MKGLGPIGTLAQLGLLLGFITTNIACNKGVPSQSQSQKAIINEVRDLIESCGSAGGNMTLTGKALVWDMQNDSPSAAQGLLPDVIQASLSDKSITVFMIIRLARKKVGTYSISKQPAYREYIGVAVALWPDKKPIGFHCVISDDPPKTREVKPEPEYGGPTPIARWIESLVPKDIPLPTRVTKSTPEDLKKADDHLEQVTPMDPVYAPSATGPNIQANQFYLKGRDHITKHTPEDIKTAVEYLEQSIQTDPGYAPAYAGLATCYNLLGSQNVLSPRESFPKAYAAARRALEIDATLVEAHAALAFVGMTYNWDWLGAEKEFERAVQCCRPYAPTHHWYAMFLAKIGRFDESFEQIKSAQVIDPRSLAIKKDSGEILYFSRQYDQAIEQLQKTLKTDQNFVDALIALGLAYERKGLFEEAMAVTQKAINLRYNPHTLAHMGYIYAVSGKRADAERVLAELNQLSGREVIPKYEVAAIHVGLADRENAFQWLEKAYKDREGRLVWLKVDPRFDGLRSDARFADLMRRVGLLL